MSVRLGALLGGLSFARRSVGFSSALSGFGAAGVFVAAGAFLLPLPQVLISSTQAPPFFITKVPVEYNVLIYVYLVFGSK